MHQVPVRSESGLFLAELGPLLAHLPVQSDRVCPCQDSLRVPPSCPVLPHSHTAYIYIYNPSLARVTPALPAPLFRALRFFRSPRPRIPCNFSARKRPFTPLNVAHARFQSPGESPQYIPHSSVINLRDKGRLRTLACERGSRDLNLSRQQRTRPKARNGRSTLIPDPFRFRTYPSPTNFIRGNLLGPEIGPIYRLAIPGQPDYPVPLAARSGLRPLEH